MGCVKVRLPGNIQRIQLIDMNDRILKRICFISFIIFFFFSLFGTSLPFQGKHQELDEISTANPINQFINIFVFLGAFICLIPKGDLIYQFIKKEKFLFIFLMWCTVSIVWSDYPFVSFKRIFQIYTSVLIILAYLLYCNSKEEMIKPIRIILYIYIFLSLVAVLTIPQARDLDFGTFRGLAFHKNTLGQICVASFVFCLIFFSYTKSLLALTINIFMLLSSIFLLIGTRSSTTIINFAIIIILSLIFVTNKIFKPLQIGNTALFFILFIGFIFGLSIFFTAPETISMIPELFGKDMTFSHRMELWEQIMLEVNQHFLFGTGFQSYWIIDSLKIQILHAHFIWMPFQSHNGYLDILNELGAIGLGLLIIMFLNYFISLFKHNIGDYWKWFIITVMVLNLQETTLFRPGFFTFNIFLLAYLKQFLELNIKQTNLSNNSIT